MPPRSDNRDQPELLASRRDPAGMRILEKTGSGGVASLNLAQPPANSSSPLRDELPRVLYAARTDEREEARGDLRVDVAVDAETLGHISGRTQGEQTEIAAGMIA